MNPQKVSVILPFRGKDSSIETRMDSVLGQTLSDIEVLCVDTGADEETRERLAQYAREDARVKLFRDDTGIMGAAKNLAIRSASGEYVGFVEQDDVVASTMYETLMRFADTHPQADVIKGDYDSFEVIDDHPFTVHRKLLSPRENDYERILNPRKHSYLFDIDMFHGTGIYRRNFLSRYNIRYRETAGTAYEDHGFWFQIFALANGVVFLPCSVYRHHVDDAEHFINKQSPFSICEEYDFAEQRVHNYRGIMEAVRIPYLAKRYKSCACVLRQMDEEGRSAFVQRMHEDFVMRIKDARDVGKIFPPNFCRRLHRELKLLLQQPGAYLEDTEKQLQSYPRRQKKFADWAARKKTEIVGAGTLGTLAQILLARYGVRIDAFVDFEASRMETIVNGVPVKPLAQLDDVQERQFLITAETDSKAVKERLQASGIKDSNIKLFELRRLTWE